MASAVAVDLKARLGGDDNVVDALARAVLIQFGDDAVAVAQRQADALAGGQRVLWTEVIARLS